MKISEQAKSLLINLADTPETEKQAVYSFGIAMAAYHVAKIKSFPISEDKSLMWDLYNLIHLDLQLYERNVKSIISFYKSDREKLLTEATSFNDALGITEFFGEGLINNVNKYPKYYREVFNRACPILAIMMTSDERNSPC